MEARLIPLESLITDLRRVETWLTQSVGVSVESPARTDLSDPFAPPDLAELKNAIDRIRPLLWVFLSRQNEARELNRKKSPASVRSLMEEAMTISDRYIGNSE